MICRYKATIPGNKIFMREYEVDSSMNLFKLQEFLCSDLEFAPDQMTVFETFSEDGNHIRRIGLFDFGQGAMDQVRIEDTIEKGEVILRFVYNIGMKLFIDLALMGEAEYRPKWSYPVLVAEKGRNPDQFSAVYEDFADYPGRNEDDPDEDAYEQDELPEGEEEL